jgi:hypothetical protein
MNNDLAVEAAVWRVLAEVRESLLLTAYRLLCVNFSKIAEGGFAASVGSVSGDGHSLRYCTVGELLRDCDGMSVMAAQEKCDDKNARSVGHPHVLPGAPLLTAF